MSDTSVEKGSRKEAMKNLKVARKDQIAAATARMKEQRQAVKAIKEHLAGVELTVPEIAAATGLPASEVLWYVASLKKYGEILEGPKAGGYYRYKLGQPVAAETAPDAAE
ncbi:MAG: winged helix-turn-helix domain-containing protein [Desulfobaccales bacterium]